jgi:SAM-dependent methyltransferase
MTIHDAMAEEYDRITDPWYTHLYERVHSFLLEGLGSEGVALDVGCGTGLQSHLLASRGWTVHGFDMSPQLVAVAEQKRVDWSGATAFERDMARFTGDRSCSTRPTFSIGQAEDVSQYRSCDLIVCVGSVLNFVTDVDVVLSHMRQARRVVLEVEMRDNLDLIWPVVDHLLRGRLGYGQSLCESWKNLLSRGDLNVQYPFEMQDGTRLELPMRLFDRRGLYQKFERHGYRVVRRGGVHSVSNVVPSTIMHRMEMSDRVRPLLWLDRVLSPVWPFSGWTCSALFELERV